MRRLRLFRTEIDPNVNKNGFFFRPTYYEIISHLAIQETGRWIPYWDDMEDVLSFEELIINMMYVLMPNQYEIGILCLNGGLR